MISTLRGRSCGKHCRTKYTSVITIFSSCQMHSPRKSLRINNRYLGEPESELSGVKSSLGARQPILSNLIASETGMRFSTGSIAIIPWTRCNFFPALSALVPLLPYFLKFPWQFAAPNHTPNLGGDGHSESKWLCIKTQSRDLDHDSNPDFTTCSSTY